MIRPDLALIFENMLMAEGFQTARDLSVKFVTLYKLSDELLSAQAHYDWGLRAVKSVLRVAGMLKRSNPDIQEEMVLCRALRDFNTPKIPNADLPIFLRLISDLFPKACEVASVVDEDLKKISKKACKNIKLQDTPGFVTKAVQFKELLMYATLLCSLDLRVAGKRRYGRRYSSAKISLEVARKRLQWQRPSILKQ